MKLFPKVNTSNFTQWTATFAVFLLGVQVGFFLGWASPNVALLSSDKSPIPSTETEISWLVALGPLGAVFGAFAGAVTIEYVGSKKSVLTSFLFMGASWICVLCANSFLWLYFARFIAGLAASIYNCCFAMYLSEVTGPKIRGTLISLASSGVILGVILSLTFETYLAKLHSFLIYFATFSLGVALLIYLKDSPYYLVRKNDLETAKKSVKFYRSDVDADEELHEIKHFVESSRVSVKDKFRQLRRPNVRKSLFIIIIAFGLQELAGTTVLLAFMERIMKSAGLDYFNPEQWVIYTNVISISSMILIFRLVDKLGRRVSLIISSIGTSFAMITMGLHFYLLKSGYDMSDFQWLPIASLLFYLITYNIGYLQVPGCLLGELFSENMKSVAACLGLLSNSFFGFATALAFEPIVQSSGYYCAFWFHAGLSFIGVPCALFLMTETKGKTLQEIQDALEKK